MGVFSTLGSFKVDFGCWHCSLGSVEGGLDGWRRRFGLFQMNRWRCLNERHEWSYFTRWKLSQVDMDNDWLSQLLNFKLFGIAYLVGKIKFKLFFRIHCLSEMNFHNGVVMILSYQLISPEVIYFTSGRFSKINLLRNKFSPHLLSIERQVKVTIKTHHHLDGQQLFLWTWSD